MPYTRSSKGLTSSALLAVFQSQGSYQKDTKGLHEEDSSELEPLTTCSLPCIIGDTMSFTEGHVEQ